MTDPDPNPDPIPEPPEGPVPWCAEIIPGTMTEVRRVRTYYLVRVRCALCKLLHEYSFSRAVGR